MINRITTLPAFVLITLLAVSSNILISQEEMEEIPLKGFPEASITIFPIMLHMTGPLEKYPEFVKRFELAFRENEQRKAVETLGLLLEEKGYDNFEKTDSVFQFPAEMAAREERAVTFSKFIRDLDLKTDYALGIEFTVHLEKSFQEVYSVIVDAKGNVVWEDSQGPGDPDFDRDFPGVTEKCCELVCRRLVPVMSLDKLPKEELAEDKKKTLQMMRAKQPPAESEFEAMEKRLQVMKQASSSARVLIYPARVGGDHTDQSSAMRISELINEAKLCQTTGAKNGPVLEGEGWPNESAVLWIFARAVKEYVQQNPAGSDYVLFADYWFAPNGQVWAVHFVICDQAGEWVIVDMQNNHQEDFQQIDPKILEDCDRLVLERLKKHLR